MKIEDFDIRVPLWAKAMGWWRRRHPKQPQAPAYQGSIIGSTIWTVGGPAVNTHRWDLFQTPKGVRSVKFIDMGSLGRSKDGSDHQLHASVITPWLHKRYEVDWKRTKPGESVYGYHR